jgi:hypothetical protein
MVDYSKVWNSPTAIKRWAREMVARAACYKLISNVDFDIIMVHVKVAVEEGKLRGDISEDLVRMGYGREILDDLYL